MFFCLHKMKVKKNDINKKDIKLESKKDVVFPIEITWEAVKHINEEIICSYDNDNKKMRYLNQIDWTKILEIPVIINDKNQWKLLEISENINTNYLIDVEIFDIKNLNELEITQEDIKNIFLVLMQKEDINLQWRWSLEMLIDNVLWMYEYYKAKQSLVWSRIVLEKDLELYNVVDRVLEIIKKRLDIVSKLEKIKFHFINKWKEPIDNWSLKTNINAENKLEFINWNISLINQEIVFWNLEPLMIQYRLKKDWQFNFEIKDSKAFKSDWIWFINKKFNPQSDIKEYKVLFESDDLFKLKFEEI